MQCKALNAAKDLGRKNMAKGFSSLKRGTTAKTLING